MIAGFLVQLYRWFPSILKVVTIIRPETLVRWHRAGFRCYWRWKSLPLGGRPQIETKLRGLIRRMSMEKPLWGAPRIHGELLKLGFEVAQSSVARCMVERWGRPARDGEPSCVTKRRTSPPWTCGRSRGAQCSAKLRQSPTMINVPMVTMVRPASSF
jgi:hypothetical protein